MNKAGAQFVHNLGTIFFFDPLAYTATWCMMDTPTTAEGSAMDTNQAPASAGETDLKTLQDAQLIAVYRRLRERRDEAKRAFTESQKSTLAVMGRIENELLGRLTERGANNISCPSGTAFLKKDRTVKAEDWEVFLPWMLDAERYDMLVRNVSKEAVLEYMETHDGELPPGLSMKQDVYVNINSPRGKGA